jgi:hypothetical protein
MTTAPSHRPHHRKKYSPGPVMRLTSRHPPKKLRPGPIDGALTAAAIAPITSGHHNGD